MSITRVEYDGACDAYSQWYDLGNLTAYNLQNSFLSGIRPTSIYFLM
jgi:hypothetical protein